jgi:hypothetical protein
VDRRAEADGAVAGSAGRACAMMSGENQLLADSESSDGVAKLLIIRYILGLPSTVF